MPLRYTARGYSKNWELDDPEIGCLSDEANGEIFVDSHELQDPTLTGLVKKIMKLCDVEDLDAVLFDSCAEPGRLDVQTMEQYPGHCNEAAMENHLELWRAGKLRLFAVTYTFYVTKISEIKLARQEQRIRDEITAGRVARRLLASV